MLGPRQIAGPGGTKTLLNINHNWASSEQVGQSTLTPQAFLICGYQVSFPHQPLGPLGKAKSFT